MLPNGADGDRVSTTKLDNPSVTTFHVCLASVLETIEAFILVVHSGVKVGDHGAFSTHFSSIVKEFINGCLHKDYVVHQIMKKHLKFLHKWETEAKEKTQDFFIAPKEICNIAK